MAALTQTWNSYGQLLVRLNPRISQSLLASADGKVLWMSDAGAPALLHPTLAILLRAASNRQSDIDGLADLQAATGPQYGFRVRGALGEVLGFVVIATAPEPGERDSLAGVHSLIKPALDCLQSELAARAAIGELNADLADNTRDLDLFQRLSEAPLADGTDALAQIPTLAIEHLPGAVAAILLPARNLTVCRMQEGQPRGMEAEVLAQMRKHLMTRAQLHGCTLVTAKLTLDGSNAALPYKALSTPIRDEVRRVVGVLAVFRRDTDADFQLREAEALELLARRAGQIIHASFDFSTGMLTQAAFVAQTKARLATEAGRTSSHGLLYIDIDQLNVVNENHGMHVGDEVIQSVATLLCRRVREGTLVARIAGDRFIMFVPGCSIEPVARFAEELRSEALSLSGARGDKPLHVSLSIGVSRIGDRDRPLDHAMAGAELACRTAKERGRNRVEVFYGNDKNRSSERGKTNIVKQVTAALIADSFELLAQPILALIAAPGDPRFEILLRMRAADGTRLSIDKLVNAAASPDLNRSIDRWVLEQSIARLAACHEVLRLHPANFSLNVSAASLADAEFWRLAEQLARDAHIEPGTLSFEVPEEAATAQIGRLAPIMERLREQGIRCTLDNFGLGISSLSNMNLLPVSCVKIDGTFSRDLVNNPRSQSMVLAITKLAKAFGIETVATHLETDAIRARAAELGVDFGQGFFIGKPLALEDVIRDLPLYSSFATSTGIFDSAPLVRPAALNG
jgi:diguanylate cyclase (GGDEF)-like protein